MARARDFDVLVCAHLSDTLFLRSAGRTVQIFHGVSFKNLSVREKALRYDYLCLPGTYHAEQYQQEGLIRPAEATALITGFPKLDLLAAPSSERDALLRPLGMSSERPTLLFAPTGDKHNALEVMGREVIERIAERDSWNLLVKPHDHPKNSIDWFRELSDLEGPRVRLIREKDVVPYLGAADLLLTDASSVALEYTLLDRPIVFLDVSEAAQATREASPGARPRYLRPSAGRHRGAARGRRLGRQRLPRPPRAAIRPAKAGCRSPVSRPGPGHPARQVRRPVRGRHRALPSRRRSDRRARLRGR